MLFYSKKQRYREASRKNYKMKRWEGKRIGKDKEEKNRREKKEEKK